MNEESKLGLATTRELRDEIAARESMGHGYDDYRTTEPKALEVSPGIIFCADCEKDQSIFVDQECCRYCGNELFESDEGDNLVD